ncbi:hypothetical protein [Dongshaea marina]|uniref:hypothetical protein n=1 Tax=Dongshaea marina TaxID=2047966 RepID=UPI000D3E54E3|nr:hypothetical protein [Dongshaea marina]
MPNQDMLIPIMPRPPAKPGSGEIKREVNKINKKQKIKEGEASAGTQKHRPEQQSVETPKEDKQDKGGIDTYA